MNLFKILKARHKQMLLSWILVRPLMLSPTNASCTNLTTMEFEDQLLIGFKIFSLLLLLLCVNSVRSFLGALHAVVCVHILHVGNSVLKSASCNLKRKQEVTAKQKLCIENKGELKNPVVYIVFSRRRKESSVGEETTWSGRLFQTGIVQGKKKNL